MPSIDVFDLTRQLIDIPSTTGEEAEAGRFLAGFLQRLGYEVETQEVASGRENLIATTGAPPVVVLSTHMDTVPPHIASREDEDFIYGRGACDAKGIIAAQIAAAEKLRAGGMNEVGLLFTVDEEIVSAGAKAANAHTIASSCRYLINGEPTDNRLAVGTKGSLQATIKTEGHAAHSAYPETGESAIEKLLDVLDDVRRVEWPADDAFGETTCNIGVMSGGTRANVIPSEARATLQIRLATNAGVVKHLLEDAIAGRGLLEYTSVHDPVRLLAIDGFEQTMVRFTTDIPYLNNWGTPLLIGPGSILDAHTAHERVAKEELLKSIELYCGLARRLSDPSK
jgi:acetylornithine deacetylase